jgi:hypothetical protein
MVLECWNESVHSFIHSFIHSFTIHKSKIQSERQQDVDLVKIDNRVAIIVYIHCQDRHIRYIKYYTGISLSLI